MDASMHLVPDKHITEEFLTSFYKCDRYITAFKSKIAPILIVELCLKQ